MNNDNILTLDKLNDEQNTYLTVVAYLEINEEGRKKIENGKSIKISELPQYLENPNKPFFGKVGLDNNFFKNFDSLRGKDTILSTTDLQLVNQMIEKGLGDIEITSIRDEKGLLSSGFQAYSFNDSAGNVGISYRGSDFDLTRGSVRDWVEANILEYFKGSSTQVNQAQEFFNENKHPDGNTYVYGASLGGNLSQHIYAENYDEIAHVFTVNGNPINQKALDTPEKIAAFNNPTKASFNIVCGDPISMLKSCDLYPNSIRYIQNNDNLRDLGGLEAHIDMGVYDENGNYKTTTRETAISTMTPWLKNFTEFARYVRETLNDIENKIDKQNNNDLNNFNELKNDTLNHFQKLFNEINHSLTSNQSSMDNQNKVDDFEKVAKETELNQIEQIKFKIMQSQLQNNNKNFEAEETQSKTI